MTPNPFFVRDSMGGTLARDHQSRAMFHAGTHRRTYVAYADHSFDARMLYFDHHDRRWSEASVLGSTRVEGHPFDGHNVPSLFVDSTGVVHVLYGAHASPFRYARSRLAESIVDWEPHVWISKRATYPFFIERTNGEILVFYRFGGAQIDSPLVFQRTRDHGKTWEDRVEVVRFGGSSSVKIHNVIYDPVHDQIHCSLHDRTNAPHPHRPSAFPAYYCQYDPAAEVVLGMNGENLGATASRQALIDSHSRMAPIALIDPQQNATGNMDLCLHQGKAYFVFNDQQERMYFGLWNGQEVERHELHAPESKHAMASTMSVVTDDGVHFELYGIAPADPPTGLGGGDLWVWRSDDIGRSWDDGTCLFDRHTMGHGLQQLNLVMNYDGDGPFVIVSEPTGAWPDGWERNETTHYNNPSRWNRRLYALDRQGNLVEDVTPRPAARLQSPT